MLHRSPGLTYYSVIPQCTFYYCFEAVFFSFNNTFKFGYPPPKKEKQQQKKTSNPIKHISTLDEAPKSILIVLQLSAPVSQVGQLVAL